MARRKSVFHLLTGPFRTIPANQRKVQRSPEVERELNLILCQQTEQVTMPKAKGEKKGAQLRHAPIGAEIEQAANPALSQGKKARAGRDGDDYVADEDVEAMKDAPRKSVNAKIFNQAREQRLEETRTTSSSSGKAIPLSASNDDSDDYEDDVDEEEDDDGEDYVHMGADSEYVEMAGLDADEEAVVGRFLQAGRAETRTLADIILEKLNAGGNGGDGGEGTDEGASAYEGPEAASLPPKVVEVYTAVGTLLSHYKAGKVPKALKMLPHLRNWEDVLWITRPDKWSPHATFVCTRIFASNLNQRMSQRFFNLVLLEKVRSDIRQQGKLNYHLYMSLKKALFKPASFYKGILLPLCQAGDCTLKEATIIGSVLAKVSIPMNHSAAALLRMAEMRYSGTTSLFIRVLVNKKYSLPRRVVDGLVQHFLSFLSETRTLPVIWHQSLLVFAQRYKLQVSDAQREQFKELLKAQHHHQITQEVRRELFNSTNPANAMQF